MDLTLDELLTTTERELTVLRAHFQRALREIAQLRQRLAELEPPAAPVEERTENVVPLPPHPAAD